MSANVDEQAVSTTVKPVRPRTEEKFSEPVFTVHTSVP